MTDLTKGMYRVRASPQGNDARRPYQIVYAFRRFGVVAGVLPSHEHEATAEPEFIGFYRTEQAAEQEIQRRITAAALLAKPPKARYKLALEESG